MKRIFILSAAVLFIYSCVKTTDNVVAPKTPSLSGKYVLYKTVDTVIDPYSNTAATVHVLTPTGDTTYSNPGTTSVTVTAGAGSPLSMFADTLVFSDASNGKENYKGILSPFTYSLSLKTFKATGGIGLGSSSKLLQLNSTNIEISGGGTVSLPESPTAYYFRKL